MKLLIRGREMDMSLESQRQESLKRRWQEKRHTVVASSSRSPLSLGDFINNGSSKHSSSNDRFKYLPGSEEDDLVSSLNPAVTVVLEGRSICQRISLHSHSSYVSLAKALRQMFVESGDGEGVVLKSDAVDLSNAVPGHLVAYEDMENDLLLAGDLNWKDFIRVAKRIRILPTKERKRT